MKKNRILRKIVSVVLCFAMLLSTDLAPLKTALAETGDRLVLTEKTEDVTVVVTAGHGVFPEEKTLSLRVREIGTGRAVKPEEGTKASPSDGAAAKTDPAEQILKSLAEAGGLKENGQTDVGKPEEQTKKETEQRIFDICVLADGIEVQPCTEAGSVFVSFTLNRRPEKNETVEVWHVHEEEGGELKTEELAVLEDSPAASEGFLSGLFDPKTTVSVETEGFSYYVLQFTKETAEYTYHLDPRKRLSVAEILGTVLKKVISSVISASLTSKSSKNGLLLIQETEATDCEIIVNPSAENPEGSYTLSATYTVEKPQNNSPAEAPVNLLDAGENSTESVEIELVCDGKSYANVDFYDGPLFEDELIRSVEYEIPEDPGYFYVERPENPVKEGYVFAGWKGKTANEWFSFAGETDPTSVNDSINLCAEWYELYPITYDLQGGIATPENPAGYTKVTEAFVLTNPEKTGYQFTGWTGSYLSEASMEVTVDPASMMEHEIPLEALAFTANWEIITYSVEYELNEGVVTPPNPSSYTVEDLPLTLTNPTKTGYEFKGWTEENEETPRVQMIITAETIGDKAFTANWQPTVYSIGYELNGGTAKGNPGEYTVESKAISLNAPEKTGYVFDGWTWSGQTAPQKTVSIPAGSMGNRTYTANWQPRKDTPYQVIHKKQNTAGTGYETAETENLTGTTEAAVTPGVKAYEGFTAPGKQTAQIRADGTTVITYLYTRKRFSIRFDMNGFGAQTAPVTDLYGAPLSAPAAPEAAGFRFDGWYTEPECRNTYTFDTMPLNGKTVYAGWTAVSPVPMPERDGWYQGKTAKTAITSIRLVKGLSERPKTFTESWDASAAGDRSLTVYVEADGKLTLAGNAFGILLPGNAHNMFRGFSAVTKIEGLELLEASETKDFSCMFAGDERLEKPDLSSWNFGKAENLGYMFYGCKSLKELYLPEKEGTEAGKTGSIETLRSMFYGCTALKTADLSGLNTSEVKDMRNLFFDCEQLEEAGISGFDTGKVTDMAGLFYQCTALKKPEISGWDTSSVTDMSYMFAGTGAESLDLSGFDTKAVTDMKCMFYNSEVQMLTLGSMDTSAVTDASFMFYGCSSLKKIVSRVDFSTKKMEKSTNMFAKCSRLCGGLQTGYTSAHAGNMYARIDRTGERGYFTAAGY